MTFDSTTAQNRRADSAQRWHERALARWEGEGGAGPARPDSGLGFRKPKADSPPLTDAELVQLQVRVIALENLVIALLAQAGEQQLEGIREMATYISPRQGFTPHRLTIHAAAEMISLVDRADRFRGRQPSATSLSLADALEVQHDPVAASPSST
ncbi:MAG TPA: hypothetical protein VMN83_23095 [Albitalea sp.]|nr:hypothetical protein [Albitalea sp.]